MSSAPKNPKINWLTCIGDSITNSDWTLNIQKPQEYTKLVQQMVGGNCRERNLGVPGNTTAQMLARIWDITRYVPSVAVIYGGINDQGQAVSTATTQTNIQTIIDKLKAAGCTRIILCNIHTIPGPSGTNDSAYDTYRTVIQNLATSNNLPLCDFHAVSLVSPTDYHSNGDMLHISASGHQKLANKLKATLDEQGWTSLLQN